MRHYSVDKIPEKTRNSPLVERHSKPDKAKFPTQSLIPSLDSITSTRCLECTFSSGSAMRLWFAMSCLICNDKISARYWNIWSEKNQKPSVRRITYSTWFEIFRSVGLQELCIQSSSSPQTSGVMKCRPWILLLQSVGRFVLRENPRRFLFSDFG